MYTSAIYFYVFLIHFFHFVDSLLDLTVTPTEDGGVTTTWRVPEGSPEFSYFYLDYTHFNSYHYGFWKTFHISNSDVQLNTTTNLYSYYHTGFTISSYDDYINSNYVGNGSYLISVIGYTGQAYWFSDEVLFTPGETSGVVNMWRL